MAQNENIVNISSKNDGTKPKCGIIMPISSIDGCSPDHWLEILSILKEVATEAGFEPNLVSDADEIGIIQKRIIQNVYNSDIIICDVSCKNPNVMFELGMRLAFDKATVVIKDDVTDYSFDTGVIEHIGYPRDLRFYKIIEFKDNLKKKLISTHEKSIKDPDYSTFLKNFGEYKIVQLEEKEISSDKYILNSLEEIKVELRNLRNISPNLLGETKIDPHLILIVKDRFNEYVKKNKIRRMSDLHIVLDDLYDYIAKDEDLRKHFKDTDSLYNFIQKNTMN